MADFSTKLEQQRWDETLEGAFKLMRQFLLARQKVTKKRSVHVVHEHLSDFLTTLTGLDRGLKAPSRST